MPSTSGPGAGSASARSTSLISARRLRSPVSPSVSASRRLAWSIRMLSANVSARRSSTAASAVAASATASMLTRAKWS